jgi:hypothetical protein
VNANGHGGKAYFVRNSVPLLIHLLEQNIPGDVKVLDGAGDHFFVLHRQKLGQDFYWVVNDSAESRRLTVQLSASGVPERWDALNGDRSPLFYRNTPSGTEVALSFGPWDAFYVVFSSGEPSPQSAQIVHTDFENLAVLSHDADGVRVSAEGPALGRNYQVVLRDDQHTYRGEFNLTGELPTATSLDGAWHFRPDAPTIPMYHALTRFDSEDNGESAGWAQPDFSTIDWNHQWLSPEDHTIRQWYAIGPFPNNWGNGFNQVFPPEKEQIFQSVYQISSLQEGNFNFDYSVYGSTAAQQRWQLYNSPDYFTDLRPVISGEFASDSSGWDPSMGPVSYALTYVYSPDRRPAQIHATAKNLKVWINGEKKLSRYTDLYYIDMRDFWGVQGDCILQQGWNKVLVKSAGNSKFTFRISNPDGSVMPDIVDSPTKTLPSEEAIREVKAAMRWYRLDVPPGAVGMKRLDLPPGSRVYLNGQPLATEGSEWRFSSLREKGNVVALKIPAEHYLASPVYFLSGTTPFRLAVWAKTGLRFYSGSASYERQVVLPPSYFGENKRIMLDCGKVGVVADVWINNKLVGTRVWEPYRFDLTEFAHPGSNELKIVVTNTMSNATDVGERFPLLNNIDVDGLVGPVKIIPEIHVKLNCARL